VQHRLAQQPRAADHRMPGEGQLGRRGEDLHVRVALDEHGL
jgi:hypothetical protein